MKWLHQLAQDVRFALRMLRRAPGFTTTVILTLAVGIGLTSAVFSVFNAVLLRPLSYPNPERLMWISTRDPKAPFPMETVLAPDFLRWKTQAASFEHIVAYDLSDEPLVIDGNATRERVAMVSEGFWELSGARLAHGHFPAASDEGALLVSYDFFEARLGGDTRSELARPPSSTRVRPPSSVSCRETFLFTCPGRDGRDSSRRVSLRTARDASILRRVTRFSS